MYYCGIDVGKGSHTTIVIDDDRQVVVPAFSVANDRAGLEKMATVLSRYQSQLHIGLEATGHYWLNLYSVLSGQDFVLTVINPMQVRAFHKTDIRRRKTDRIDAFWIADFVRFSHPSPSTTETPNLLQLRELTRFRFRLTQQIGDCKRKIISILDRVFPEYEKIFSDIFLQSSRRLLQEAVTAADFADLELAELEGILSRSSRGRFGRDKAEAIQAAARQSVGVSFLTDAVRVEMRCLLQQIDLLEQQRATIDAQVERLMADIPQHILSIPGVGEVTGAMILAEIGDITRFPGPEKLVAYAGIDASVYQTGQFEGDQMHMSKRGSHYLRYALWQAGMGCLLHNSELSNYYWKKRAEGKAHGVAMGALCRKLLGRVYIILKENRPYQTR
jgi:transposase